LRFLARDRPDIAEALVRELVPGLLGEGTALEPESVDDLRLDLPPPLDADFIARVGKRVQVDVASVVLSEVKASRLLQNGARHVSLPSRIPKRGLPTSSVSSWPKR
jgi:hypothetical protein